MVAEMAAIRSERKSASISASLRHRAWYQRSDRPVKDVTIRLSLKEKTTISRIGR